MNEPTPTHVKEAAEEINLASNDLIAASMGRLPQALPIQRIESILLKYWPKPKKEDDPPKFKDCSVCGSIQSLHPRGEFLYCCNLKCDHYEKI